MSDYWSNWHRSRLSRRGFIGAAGATGVGAAALGLVGCGADDEGSSSGGNGGSSSGGGSSAIGDPTDLATIKKMTLEQVRSTFSGERLKNLPGNKEKPVKGGTLRFASRAPVTWDPTSPAGGLMASYMWANNQLIQIKVNDFVKNPNFMEYEPVLAEKMPEQPDDKTYIFKLRQGVKFQNVAPVNGREFTAEDVVYCTEVYRKSPAQAPTYSELDKVEAVDKYTVKFTMKSPVAQFLVDFSVPFHWIFSKEQHTSPDGLKKGPIGTGGFLLEKAEELGGYTFVRNPDYFRKDQNGVQLPYVDKLETTYYPNPAQSIAAFRAGTFDHLWPQNWEAWISVLESNPDSVTQVTTPPPSFQPYISMRQNEGPLKDVRVRRALSLLIDRPGIIKSLAYGMAGYGYGQDWTYFGREWPWEGKELGKYQEYNVAEAKKLLEAAGVKELTLDFLYTQFAGFNFEVWNAVAGMWAANGIKTVIDAPQDPAKWQSQFYGSTYKALVGTGNLGPGMDPDTFAYQLHSKSPKNTSTVNDPKIDELATKQRQTLNKEERTKVLKELMDYDLDQVTRLFLVTPYKFNLRKPNTFSLTDTEAAWNPVGWGSVGLDTAWKKA